MSNVKDIFGIPPEQIRGAPVLYLKGTGKIITYKDFCELWEANRPKKEDVLARVKAVLREYEEKYNMTTEEFVKTIYGTPAEDTADFLDWGMGYEAYLRLTKGEEENGISGEFDSSQGS